MVLLTLFSLTQSDTALEFGLSIRHGKSVCSHYLAMVIAQQQQANDNRKHSLIMSNQNRKKKSMNGSSSSAAPILSEEYLDGYKNKNDLVHRLQNVIEALSEESIIPSPALDGLASRLCWEEFLCHKDKEVRLYSVMSCLEIFAIYAPEPPFDPSEIFLIFSQLIFQLSNLSHTFSESQPNYHNYFSILEHLSEVRTGIVLVEYCRGYSPHNSPSDEDDEDEDDDQVVSRKALELLTDLIRILLDSISDQHSSEVRQHAVSAIASCIGEFQQTIPICILDVLLSAISKGPKIWVHPAVRQQLNGEIAAASRHSKRTTTATQASTTALEKVDNISYRIAAKVIETTKDKCSTPIALLLNGILNGEPFALSHSSISADDPYSSAETTSSNDEITATQSAAPNVWSIVYEMHRIAPDILTTVIGTIASNLRSEETHMRLVVVKLLGKLFYSSAKSSKIAVRFLSCYKEWCQRSKDTDVEIRSTVLVCLGKTLETFSTDETNNNDFLEVRLLSTSCLEAMVTSDPDSNIRDAAIQQVCQLCLTRTEIMPPSLLRAVGDRVKSKHTTKAEKKDALTGLAQLYHIHYLQKKLMPLEQLEDEKNTFDYDNLSNAQLISNVLLPVKLLNKKKTKEESSYYRSPAQIEEQFYWIPEIVMESAWYTDQIDSDMRNRVIQIIDDILLGPCNTTSEKESNGSPESNADRIKMLSATSKALGFTLMLNSLVVSREEEEEEGQDIEETNAYKWLSSLLLQRASLQSAISAYIDARSQIKNHPVDSVDSMKANAAAFAALEKVASLTPTPAGTEKDKLLQSVHGARDRHLFRVLAAISTPLHSKTSRSRAFQDLPLRAKQCSFTKSEITWIKTCARRCAMGAIDVEMTEHLILLAKLCVKSALETSSSDFKSNIFHAMCFLRALKLVCKSFPKMATVGFSHLQEIFFILRSQKSRRSSKELEKSKALISLCNNVLKLIALAMPHVVDGIDQDFEKQLLSIAAARDPHSSDFIRPTIQILSFSKMNRFDELLKMYGIAPTLSVTGDKHLTCVMMGLTMLSECFSDRWCESSKSSGGTIDKIVDFVFHKILLLNSHSEESDLNKSPGVKTSPSCNTSASHNELSRSSAKGRAEDISSTICASIEFLCSHIRCIHGVEAKSRPIFKHERAVIQCILKIARGGGVHAAWSSSKTLFRSTPENRSQIRRAASLSLFRIIGDVALKLEDVYPSIELWHSIANTLLDEESDVRSVIIKEWMQAVSGSRKYCHGKKFAPSLRFLAMGVFCVDGEHSYPMANGFAGNVQNLCVAAKETAFQCVVALRRTCQIVEAQCAALGPEGESNFERRLKMKIMPEFTVPFVFHLLSHRPETPTSYPSDDVDEESSGAKRSKAKEIEEDEESDFCSCEYVKARCRQLRKRLLWLFEPLVHSLGECGDNITFLLRMSELLGRNFQPVLASPDFDESDASKRLAVICRAARDVLLKFVKKDADLSPYAGPIQIPTNLFVKRSSLSQTKSKQQSDRARVSFSDRIEENDSSDEEERGFDDVQEAKTNSNEKKLDKRYESSKTNGHASSRLSSEIHTVSSLSSKRKNPSDETDSSDYSTKDKQSSSNKGSTVHLGTPPHEEDWGMSPIAPSASPRNFDSTESSTDFSVHDQIPSSEVSAGIGSTPHEEDWGETQTTTPSETPKNNPSSLSAILRKSGKNNQMSSNGKKLSVSFSSSETLSGGKKVKKADESSTTPMSDISDESKSKTGAKKGTKSKKPIIVKMSPKYSIDSKQPATSKSRTRGSARRNSSHSSKSPNESDLDFDEGDDFESVRAIKTSSKQNSNGGGKRKIPPKTLSVMPQDKIDSYHPAKRTRKTKDENDPSSYDISGEAKKTNEQNKKRIAPAIASKRQAESKKKRKGQA